MLNTTPESTNEHTAHGVSSRMLDTFHAKPFVIPPIMVGMVYMLLVGYLWWLFAVPSQQQKNDSVIGAMEHAIPGGSHAFGAAMIIGIVALVVMMAFNMACARFLAYQPFWQNIVLHRAMPQDVSETHAHTRS